MCEGEILPDAEWDGEERVPEGPASAGDVDGAIDWTPGSRRVDGDDGRGEAAGGRGCGEWDGR